MILFCDFDGTLHRREINGDFERNKEAIKRFRTAGNQFVIATGRSLMSLLDDFPDYLEYSDYLIADNGAFCLKDGELLFEYVIPEGEAREIAEFIKAKAGDEHKVIFTFHTSRHEPSEPDGDVTKLRIWIDKDEFMYELDEALSDRFEKDGLVSFAWSKDALAKIGFFPDGGVSCLMDITPKGAGKENALERLAETLGDERIVAVGDSMNDMGMLRRFNGYIMRNAFPELLDDFDESHRVDSVADLIDNLMK